MLVAGSLKNCHLLARAFIARNTASGRAGAVGRASGAVNASATAGQSLDSGQALTLHTAVREAVEICCASVKRTPGPAEGRLVDRLEENWYHTVSDVLTMSEGDIATLQVPLRLMSQLKQLTALPAEDGLAAEAAPVATVQPGAAEQITKSEASPSGSIDEATDLMQRRAPPSRRFQQGSFKDVKLTTRSIYDRYSIKGSHASETLQTELALFHNFCTTKFYGQQDKPIAPVTARKYEDHLRCMLGYLHFHQQVPLEELSLRMLVPSAERAGVATAYQYIQWLVDERAISPSYEMLAIRGIIQVAKYLYHSQSQSRPSEGDKAYDDLMVVRELRSMVNDAKRRSKVFPRASNEAQKWLEWPEFLHVVSELHLECAARDSFGKHRTRQHVAWSLQRYLIFAILSCVPDRQRTIRELQVGHTLFKEGNLWVIRHQAHHYKTGKSYGERPPLQLSPKLYPELEEFLATWRKELQPQHSFVFSQLSGKPLTTQDVHKIFQTCTYRIAGKKTNPHLVRDMIVTHLKSTGASEKELEALALYMGHSLAMQRSNYDRRTKAAKVEPAVELLAALNGG